MKFRTFLSVTALVAAAALPAVASAQRHRSQRNSDLSLYGRGYYGSGPFGPSRIPGPSARYYSSGGPYQINGLTYYFGPGGATYYQASPLGYGSFYDNGYSGGRRYRPRREWLDRRDSRSRYDRSSRSRRD